ncbi:MAG: glycosyltransferase, partial [Phaeodactylibacter sp.]|nr:glycosyltransferase [Phaeodactylibacter sp.]
MENKHPKISVITVVYNAVDLLEDTLLSVLNQTYDNIEYVVVDGASTDGTTEIVHRYKDRIDRWVSEPDKGLYNAMNKGLAMATGDFVWFMNAGDHIYSPDTLEKAVQHYTPETDLL